MRFSVLMLLLAEICASAQSAEYNYPERPVRVMVPFPPGGANDIVARFTAQKLSKRWSKVVRDAGMKVL